MLYEPDDKRRWKTNDDIIFQSNPLALEIEDNLDYLYKQRKLAIEVPNERTNFLTKHLNIFLQNDKEEVYLDIDKWKSCSIDKVDFTGKEVTVAFDLSLTTDLTAVSMMYKEDEKYFV